MVIILEALFVDNQKDEPTFKFKMRQSYFFNKLGKGTNNFKNIDNWYSIRSSVLHGSKKYDDPKLYKDSSLQETNELIFENVKLAIFEYIKGNLDPKKIDEEMVGNTTSSPETPKSPR
jgi:Apea-like HEPN